MTFAEQVTPPTTKEIDAEANPTRKAVLAAMARMLNRHADDRPAGIADQGRSCA